MATSTSNDKFYIVKCATTNPKAQLYDLIRIDGSAECLWRAKSFSVIGGCHYPAQKLASGGFSRTFTTLIAREFSTKEKRNVDILSEDQFNALLYKDFVERKELYLKMLRNEWHPPQKSLSPTTSPMTVVNKNPDETDVFLAIEEVKLMSRDIPAGTLFVVKKNGDLFDAVTERKLLTCFDSSEKIRKRSSVKKVPQKHLPFLKLCDNRVSVFLSGQLQILDKSENSIPRVVVMEGTTRREGRIEGILKDEGLLSIRIGQEEETMTIEHVFDFNTPNWLNKRIDSFGFIKYGDGVHLPGIGFGVFRWSITLPGQSAPSCVAELVTDYPGAEIPPCLRPYLHKLVRDPNLVAVCPVTLVKGCKFYTLKAKFHINGNELPDGAMLAKTSDHEVFDLRDQLPLGVCYNTFQFPAEEVSADEISRRLLTENAAKREHEQEDFQRRNEAAAHQTEENMKEANAAPQWVIDALLNDKKLCELQRDDLVEMCEDVHDHQYSYGIVKTVMKPPGVDYPLLAVELFVATKKDSIHWDTVAQYLPVLGVDPKRAVILPAEELSKCKFYILLRKYTGVPAVSQGSLLAWNSDKYLRAVDWQIDLRYQYSLAPYFDVEELSSEQLPFLFRIEDGSQRLAVHTGGIVGRLLRNPSSRKEVLFLREDCDSEHLPFGEFGTITRHEDGFVFVQIDNMKEEKTHLGRVCDIDHDLQRVTHDSDGSSRGDSVTIVQGESRLCGTVLGVFRLPWHKEDVVIVQHLMDDVGAAAVPEAILRRLFPVEDCRRAAAYLASAVKKSRFYILTSEYYSSVRHIDIPEGTLVAEERSCQGYSGSQYQYFCFDLNIVLDYVRHTEEISLQQLPFLFRIDDGSQRLAVHRSGLLDRLLRSSSPPERVLFLREDSDSDHLQFGELGAITHHEDGCVFVQIDNMKEEETHLGRVCDIDHDLQRVTYDSDDLSPGDSVIIFQENHLCGTVLGVFRLPWHKEDVVIVQHLMDDVGAAAVPEEILRLLFPAEDCHRAAAYLASAVKKCEFFITTRTFNSITQSTDIPKGSLMAKDSVGCFLYFGLGLALDLGKVVTVSSDLKEVSALHLPFLYRISDAEQRLSIHCNGFVDRLLHSSLPLERVLFFPKGFDAGRVSFFVNCAVTGFEDGFVVVQTSEEHRTSLDNILMLEDGQDYAYYPSTYKTIKPGDIVDVEESCYEDVINVGKNFRWTIRMTRKFPGQSESSAIVEISQKSDNVSGEVRPHLAVCPVKALTKVSSLKDKGACAQSSHETNDGSTMVDFCVVESSIGVPSVDPGRPDASATYASDAHVPREKPSENYGLDSIKNDDTCGNKMDVDKSFMSEESCDEPMDTGDSETEGEKEKTDREGRDREKINIHEKNHLLGTCETGENQNREEDRRGKQRRTSESAPRTADKVADEDEGKEPQPSGEETASAAGSTKEMHLFVKEKIEDLPLESRVCFFDDTSPPKLLAGTVKWTGKSHIVYTGAMVAVVVLDQRHKEGTNGCFSGKRLLTCASGRALLIGTDRLQKIPQVRCGDVVETILKPKDRGCVVKVEAAEGKSDTITVEVDCGSGPRSAKSMVLKQFKTHEVRKISEGRRGAFSPWKMKVLGEKRGIQGEGNSCYLDSLLFSLFAFSDAAKEKVENASEKGEWFQETYDALIKNIVTVLRSSGYVPSAAVKSLRRLMADASKEEKFTDSSRDIPECMETLFQKMLELQPFVTIRSSNNVTGTFVVETLLVEGVDTVTSQMCLEYAAMHMDFVLSSVDDCIMIQLPRDRANYSVVIPSKTLSLRWCQGVTDKSQCSRCNSQSVTHLDPTLFDRQGLRSTFLCSACAKYRRNATGSHFLLQDGASDASWVTSMPELHLSAVICIESSHYNAFVRTGSTDPKWVFFDSMADQKQERTNIPKIQAVNVDDWLDEASAVDKFDKAAVNQYKKEPADIYKRLFQYPYMFIYHT